MLNFIIRRALWTLLVMFAITLLVFVIFFKTPGVDPARQIAGRNPSPQVLAEIRHQFGLDEPFPVQYGLMMKKIFITRDLVSYSNQGQKVIPEIAAGRAGHPVAGVRGRRHLGGGVDQHGAAGRSAQRHLLRSAPDDRGPDRHLHTGVLAR